MILQSLDQLYDRLAKEPGYELARPGRSPQKISFKVVIRIDGSLVAIEDVRTDQARRKAPLQIQVLGGTRSSGSGLNPCFLWDKPQYMLGVTVGNDKAKRSAPAFEAFRKLHLSAEEEIGDPGFSAVCRFLERWLPEARAEDPVLLDAGTAGFGVFQLAGETRYVHEIPAIQDWWDQQRPSSDAPEGECLVTGNVAPLARTHEKVKGLVGQRNLGPLIGFNDSAYESYGMSQSFNAPVSEGVAFRYVTALNALLNGPRRDMHRIPLADTTLVFWTELPNPVEDFFAQFATAGLEAETESDSQDQGRLSEIGAFLRALRAGKEAGLEMEGGTRYFIFGLSPNAARISVRLFLRGTVADLLEKLRLHHEHIRLARRPPRGKWRGDPEFPSLRDLLDQTARDRTAIPPLLASPLIRAILEGGPYPHALYAAVLRRIGADRKVDYLRGCVIQGYLNRNLNKELSMALDRDRHDPPYRLGRLFAALEMTQKDALGGKLNKTIRDSFYSSASATPRAVFPRLLRTYQHHLSKLEGGRRVTRERLVQEILSPMDGFQAHLNLADQGLFAIGYYHQIDDFYRKSDGSTNGNKPTPTEEA
jgi:CRISPR-associated protein Csd1